MSSTSLLTAIPGTVKHIVFDLDHTLWDYDRNAGLTLAALYHEYDLQVHGTSEQDFVQAYGIANHKVWAAFSAGTLAKHELRRERFHVVEAELGWARGTLPASFGIDFLHRCPKMPHVLPGALEVLELLKGKYGLHLLTNGFSDSQFSKAKASGLDVFLDHIICSDAAGAPKPSPQAFHYVQKLLNAQPKELLMIGDNPVADVEGAKKQGWFAWHYQYSGPPAPAADLVFSHWNEWL